MMTREGNLIDYTTKEKIKGYIILMRPYSFLIPLIVVFSALCNGQFDFFPLLGLFIIGILFHIFGFVQNDYFDLEIDKKSKYVSERPLAKGLVSRKGALFIVLFSFFAAIILAYLFFFTLLSFLTLLLSFFLVTLYNKYSKRMPGMEYVLGAGVCAFALFGALTVSNVLSPLVIFIVLFVLTKYASVSVNVKDVKYDSKQGIKTTPILLGVRAIDDELRIPAVFTIYAFSIKGINIGIALMAFIAGYVSMFLPSYVRYVPMFLYGSPLPIICFSILSTLIIYTLWKILYTPLSDRDKMVRYAGIHELLTYLLVPVVLMSYLVENFNIFAPILLIAVPPLWVKFYVRAFFGKSMPLE
jgi:4-hydroxybenzoate polyprenyltransferase